MIGLAALFCLGFGGMTVAVAAQSGFTVLTAISLLIVLMIGSGVVGALLDPPDDEDRG